MSLTTRVTKVSQLKSQFNLTSHQALSLIRVKETASLALQKHPDCGLSFEQMLLAIYWIRQAVFFTVLNALHEQTKKTRWSRLMRLTPEIDVESTLFKGIRLRDEEVQDTGRSEEDIPRIEVDEPRLCSEMSNLFPPTLAKLTKLDALKEMAKRIEESQVPSFSLGDKKSLNLKQVVELAKAELDNEKKQRSLAMEFSIPLMRDHAFEEIGERATHLSDHSLTAWFNNDTFETLLGYEGIFHNECMPFGVDCFLISEMGLMNKQYDTARNERRLGELWTQRYIALSQVLSSEGRTKPCSPKERIEKTIKFLQSLLQTARSRLNQRKERQVHSGDEPESLIRRDFNVLMSRTFLFNVVNRYQSWLLATLADMQSD